VCVCVCVCVCERERETLKYYNITPNVMITITTHAPFSHQILLQFYSRFETIAAVWQFSSLVPRPSHPSVCSTNVGEGLVKLSNMV